MFNMFALAVKFPVSFPDKRILTSNMFIKIKENQAIFLSILLTQQFWADPDTAIYLEVRSYDEIFLTRLDYVLYVKDWQLTYYKLSCRLARD